MPAGLEIDMAVGVYDALAIAILSIGGISLIGSLRFLAKRKLQSSFACIALAVVCFPGPDFPGFSVVRAVAAALATEETSEIAVPNMVPTPEEATRQWKDIMAHAVAPPLGNANARFSMVLFGDFQCPSCGRVNPASMDAVRKSHGTLNLYFVDRPFMQMHKFALPAAQAARAAAAEGKFWPMYDVLFENQTDLEPGNYGAYAKKAGVNPKKIAAALHDKTLADKVRESAKFCDNLPVIITPAIAVMDNRTHKVISVAGNRTDIAALLAKPFWN